MKDFFKTDFLVTRDSVNYLTTAIDSSPETEVVLDFSGINHISRSFVDEIYVLQKKMEGQSVQVSFEHSSEFVQNMFDVVKRQRERSGFRN